VAPRRLDASTGARTALVVALLVVATLGVGALADVDRTAQVRVATQPRVTPAWIVLAVLAFAVVLLPVVLRLARGGQRLTLPPRRPARASRLQQALVGLVTLMLVILAARVVLERPEPLAPPDAAAADPSAAAAAPADDRTVAVVTLAVLLAALVLTTWLGWWLLRRRRLPEPERLPEPLADRAVLGAAVTAGEAALAGPARTPREAVLACYEAMQQVLRSAGAEPQVSDSPGELLSRAITLGVVAAEPADRLTTLFAEARFSTHPVGEAERAEAHAALQRLHAGIAGMPA